MFELGIAIGLLFFLILSIIKRELGIYLIILLLPTYQIRFEVFGIPATFLEAIILTMAAVVSFSIILSLRTQGRAAISELLRRTAPRNDKTVSIFIFLFLLAAGISVFVAPDTVRAAGIFKAYFFEAVLFYFLVRVVIDTREKLENAFRAVSYLVLYLSVFGLYQFATLANLPSSWWAVDVASRRIVSLLNHPNALALVLGPLLAMLIIKRYKNKLARAAIIFGAIAFYLTFSRAGWLAFVATIGGFLVMNSVTRKNLQKSFVVIVAAAILVLAIPFSRAKLLELTRADDPSKQNRYVLWSAAADILKQHPLTGVGLMGFREAYKSYPLGPDRVVQNYPHNFFLNFWLETGLLGLLSMLGLLILFAKKIRALARTEYRGLALAAAAGMTMIVLHSLVDVSYFKNDLAVLFWLIYSLPFVSIFSSASSA